jgi:hypothetical protein
MERLTIQERNLVIQEVIDRLIYLPEDDLKKFNSYLDTLFNVYSIDVKVVDGIRVYNVKRN